PCLARRRAAVSGERVRVIGVRQSDIPKITRRRKYLARWTISIVAGGVAAGITLAVTRPPALGLDPDAASYLGAAQSLAEGRGYRIPIADWATADSTSALSHFPPGYPTAIALPVAVGMTPMNAARAVNAATAFVDIGVASWLVTSIAGSIAGIVLALALVVMPVFVELHASVLSEPLFLACTM